MACRGGDECAALRRFFGEFAQDHTAVHQVDARAVRREQLASAEIEIARVHDHRAESARREMRGHNPEFRLRFDIAPVGDGNMRRGARAAEITVSGHQR